MLALQPKHTSPRHEVVEGSLVSFPERPKVAAGYLPLKLISSKGWLTKQKGLNGTLLKQSLTLASSMTLSLGSSPSSCGRMGESKANYVDEAALASGSHEAECKLLSGGCQSMLMAGNLALLSTRDLEQPGICLNGGETSAAREAQVRFAPTRPR